MTGRRVFRGSKPAGWWTPERRQMLWDMYVRGDNYEDIAAHFGVTIAAAQRKVYEYKKEQSKCPTNTR